VCLQNSYVESPGPKVVVLGGEQAIRMGPSLSLSVSPSLSLSLPCEDAMCYGLSVAQFHVLEAWSPVWLGRWCGVLKMTSLVESSWLIWGASLGWENWREFS
jgi:hypothetical protein